MAVTGCGEEARSDEDACQGRGQHAKQQGSGVMALEGRGGDDVTVIRPPQGFHEITAPLHLLGQDPRFGLPPKHQPARPLFLLSMAGKVLRFSAAEAADVLRGSKSALLKDAADLRDLEISDGAVLCGETDEGTAFCELRVTSFFQGSFSSLPQDIVLDDGMKAKKFEAGVEVAHIKFEVVKVAFSPSLSSALRYSAVTPAA
eukprot:333685-Rhodomonas_salina.1